MDTYMGCLVFRGNFDPLIINSILCKKFSEVTCNFTWENSRDMNEQIGLPHIS